MKTKQPKDIPSKQSNVALGLDNDIYVKSIIPNTIKPVGNWAKVIDTEGDLHAVFMVCIGRAVTGSNATYIINIAKWSSVDLCEINASMLNKSGSGITGHRISYRITANRLEVWIYSDAMRVVSCLSANYNILNITETPPSDAISMI